ncbi:MAG: 1-(5-phosphoribosyl)-5-[(5-phosphoribosylamino)methylideneamino]imidazole-4-carboxamide isomerase [Dongiaceae bacterium]
MILYPAIDLKEGAVVRLKRGDMDAATVYRDDPAAQARDFANAGAQWLHVVDLDGAISGRAVNGAAVDAILTAVSIPVQLGGGIRDMARAEAWIARGVARLVLGTAALKAPDFVREACREFPGKVAIGIDARDGKVAIEGWAETSDMNVADLAKRFEDEGAAALIHTDIERDGMLSGVNVAATAALARATRLPVIASGGVASLEDLRALKSADAPIAGVISGRALYDGRLDLGAALALLAA